MEPLKVMKRQSDQSLTIAAETPQRARSQVVQL